MATDFERTDNLHRPPLGPVEAVHDAAADRDAHLRQPRGRYRAW